MYAEISPCDFVDSCTRNAKKATIVAPLTSFVRLELDRRVKYLLCRVCLLTLPGRDRAVAAVLSLILAIGVRIPGRVTFLHCARLLIPPAGQQISHLSPHRFQRPLIHCLVRPAYIFKTPGQSMVTPSCRGLAAEPAVLDCGRIIF